MKTIKDTLPTTFEEFHALTISYCNHYIRCISCGEPFSPKNVHTKEGWRETQISSICEDCYDALFEDEEDDNN